MKRLRNGFRPGTKKKKFDSQKASGKKLRRVRLATVNHMKLEPGSAISRANEDVLKIASFIDSYARQHAAMVLRVVSRSITDARKTFSVEW
jgi:hypothetical protein